MADSGILALRRSGTPQPNITTMHPAVYALMNGLTNLRSETAAKQAAEEVANAPTPEIHLKTRVDPGTGQTVHDVTHKNVQFGDAEQKVQDAYDAPQEEFSKVVDRAALQSGIKAPDEGIGQQASWSDHYRLEREAGNNPLSAAVRALLAGDEKGSVISNSDERAAVNRRRIAERAQLASVLKGEYSENQADRRLNNADRTNARLATKERERDINNAILKTDWTGVTPEDRAANLAAQVGASPDDITPAHLARLNRTTSKQEAKQHADKLESFRKDPAIGQYPTFHAALQSLNEKSIDPDEEAQLKVDYARHREETLRTRQNEIFRANSERRAADASARAADNQVDRGKTVDAGQLFRGTLRPEDLIAMRGNRRFNQDSVAAAIDAGAEHFTNAIKDRQGRIEENNRILEEAPDSVKPADARRLERVRQETRRLIRENTRDSKTLERLQKGAPASPPTAALPTAAAPVVTGTRGSVVAGPGGKFAYVKH